MPAHPVAPVAIAPPEARSGSPPSASPPDLFFLGEDLSSPAPIVPLDVEMESAAPSPPPAILPPPAPLSSQGILGSGPSANPFGSAPPLATQNGDGTIPSATPKEHSWADRANGSTRYPKVDTEVRVSEEGIPRVRVPNVVFERGAKLHSDYIVGVFYGKAPSYGKVWGVLNYLWGRDRKVTIQSFSSNVFLFHIPSASLRRKILHHELWRVGDSPFFVTEWKASFSFNPPSLQWAPIWAMVTNVPFDLITDEGIAFLAKPLGKLVDAKPFTKVDSVEIKVVVNLSAKLPQFVEIEREDAQIVRLAVSYPWLPPLCPICKEFGHKSNLCPEGPANQSDPKPSTTTKSTKTPSKHAKQKNKHAWVPVSTSSEKRAVDDNPDTGKSSIPNISENSGHTILDHSIQKGELAASIKELARETSRQTPSAGKSSVNLSTPTPNSAVISSTQVIPTSNAFAILQDSTDSADAILDDMVIDPGAISLLAALTKPKSDITFSSPSSSAPKDKKLKKRKFTQRSPTGDGRNRTPLLLGDSSY